MPALCLRYPSATVMDRPQNKQRHISAPRPNNAIRFDDELTPQRLGDDTIPFSLGSEGIVMAVPSRSSSRNAEEMD